MPLLLLTCALLAVLISDLTGSGGLLAVASVSALTGLVALCLSHRAILWGFWLWLNLILLSLIYAPVFFPETSTDLVLQLPIPALEMLVGVWIIPILIWPLGFLFTFKKWIRP